jgi:hypothetical protein
MKRPSGFYRTSQAFQSGANQAGRSTAVAGVSRRGDGAQRNRIRLQPGAQLRTGFTHQNLAGFPERSNQGRAFVEIGVGP